MLNTIDTNDLKMHKQFHRQINKFGLGMKKK